MGAKENDLDLKALDRDLQNRPPQPKRGWWSRNWKRLFTLLVLLILAGVGYGGWYFYQVLGNEAYQQAMVKIRENKEIAASLGEPIKMVYVNPLPAIFQDGNDFSIRWSVTGSTEKQAKALVKTRKNRETGKWQIVQVEVAMPNGKKLLLNDDEGGAPIFEPQPAVDAKTNPAGEKPAKEELPTDLSPKMPEPEETK